jgi:hypothetical protein
MAYQGTGGHSPNYDDVHDPHDSHRLQDVPGSQVREEMAVKTRDRVGADPGGFPYLLVP